jgi:hypothetical protein
MKKFEDISFENLVYFYREELLEINQTGTYPESLTKFIRTNLRRYGILNVQKGHKKDHVYLTEKALKSLNRNFCSSVSK